MFFFTSLRSRGRSSNSEPNSKRNSNKCCWRISCKSVSFSIYIPGSFFSKFTKLTQKILKNNRHHHFHLVVSTPTTTTPAHASDSSEAHSDLILHRVYYLTSLVQSTECREVHRWCRFLRWLTRGAIEKSLFRRKLTLVPAVWAKKKRNKEIKCIFFFKKKRFYSKSQWCTVMNGVIKWKRTVPIRRMCVRRRDLRF